MVTRKQVFVGLGITLAATVGVLLYQFWRLKNYVITIKGIDVKKVSLANVQFDAYLNFINKSDLTIALAYQKYDVYINDKLITKLSSDTPQLISPKATSVLKVAVDLSPQDLIKKLGASSLSNILTFKQQVLRIDAKMGVKFGNLVIPISTSISDKIVNWATPAK